MGAGVESQRHRVLGDVCPNGEQLSRTSVLNSKL
jgi:hypothetical protein